MTINLAPSRRSPLLPHNGSRSRKPCYSAVFLIANARLRLRLTHRKLSPLKFPNRERMAISHRTTAPPTSAQHEFRPPTTRSLSAKQPRSCPQTKPGFLIVTQGLELPLKRVKTTSSKFLIATKRSFIFRPVAWNSPPSLRSPNFNLGQRNEPTPQVAQHSIGGTGCALTTTNPQQAPTTPGPISPAQQLQSNHDSNQISETRQKPHDSPPPQASDRRNRRYQRRHARPREILAKARPRLPRARNSKCTAAE